MEFFFRSRDILDDFREAYYWLWQNTKEDATVMSWWDYGYQIAGMANRTTLVDNNTWNNSHIALVIIKKYLNKKYVKIYLLIGLILLKFHMLLFIGRKGYVL